MKNSVNREESQTSSVTLHMEACFQLSFRYIYTPSVFCYDKHKKNFDIQFSLKRHETV